MKQPAVATPFNQTEVHSTPFILNTVSTETFPFGILQEECADMCIYLLNFHLGGYVVALLH